MLNYNKIASDLNKKNIPLTVLARTLGVAYTSFKDRYDRQKLYADEIEFIADYFGRTIAYYFDREEKQIKPSAEPEAKLDSTGEPCPCCVQLKTDIERLNERLNDKQEIIDALKDANAALKGENKKNVANRAS